MNKLIRGNLVRGLPLKLFEINQTVLLVRRENNTELLVRPKLSVQSAQTTTNVAYGFVWPNICKEFNEKDVTAYVVIDVSPKQKPALGFMRPFGYLVTILNTIDHLGKFDGKADEGFFIGYSINSKAFRVFNSRTRIVEENLDV
ncbi:putative ribonuclease H-like domain-containing protein [Tanacetum coccineum]